MLALPFAPVPSTLGRAYPPVARRPACRFGTPLPDALQGSVFTRAKATELGVPRSRFRAADLVRPHRGVLMAAEHARSLHHACAALALVVHPSAFFVGPTAAQLHGIPLPRHLDYPEHPIEIAVPPPLRAIRREGVRGRTMQITAADVGRVAGVRVASAARTWCDLSEYLTVAESVAAADWITFRGRRLASAADLEAAMKRHVRPPRPSTLITALTLTCDRAESPKESEMRVIVTLGGLPVPLVNPELFDERGVFVARVDLFFEDWGEVLDYKGDQHRTLRRQWQRDLSRTADIEALGMHVTEVTNLDLDGPARFLARTRRALRLRGWPGDP